MCSVRSPLLQYIGVTSQVFDMVYWDRLAHLSELLLSVCPSSFVQISGHTLLSYPLNQLSYPLIQKKKPSPKKSSVM